MIMQRPNESAHDNSLSATDSTANDAALLNRRQLARALSVSPRSVDNFQKRKIIPCIRISPRCVRFSLRAVLRALEKFEVREAGR
jgi:hypothetical protein